MSDIEHHAATHVRRGRWVLAGFLAVAGFFLWTEHRAHLLGVLPWLLFLACPLMHLFHHSHGHHHGKPLEPAGDRTKTEEPHAH